MNNFNAILTTITLAAIVGLLVRNPAGTAQIFSVLGKSATDYIKAIQGQ